MSSQPKRGFPGMLAILGLLGIVEVFAVSAAPADVWYAGTGDNASDTNPGTEQRPILTVEKAVSLAKPGDTVVFSAGTYPCSEARMPDGGPDQPIVLRSAGKGRVVFSGDGRTHLLLAGSYNSVSGIEFEMTSDAPKGYGISIVRKDRIAIRNCRFFSCDVGVKAVSARHILVENCEMAFSGTYGIHLMGSGEGPKGHWDPADGCAAVEIRNCYLHDAGWNIEGTEGYGITANGACEGLVIENCQIDNNTGDGILFEDWTVHSSARYNVIRGSAIAALWIDNASMSVFDNNYLEANNVAAWLSGEESSNRFLSDFIAIRYNIIVHNDWTAFGEPSLYGKDILLLTTNTRDVYFDNNTIAYNRGGNVVGVQNRPPQNEFRNIWFRNNIFWENTGGVSLAAGVDPGGFHFENNLWDKPFESDTRACKGDPRFADPASHAPEGYKLGSESAAIDRGLLLYENPVDFWNGPRPHQLEGPKYDLGAHEFGAAGAAHIGLDLAVFPFEVPPFELRFKARPKR